MSEFERFDLVRNSNDKSYLFVKLTDSALTAIEEYSKTILDATKKGDIEHLRPATIQFHSNRGVLKLPGPCQNKRYTFSMSNLDADGSIECIRQSKNGWQSLGNVACKLQIQAEEDIYQKTKSKVAAAEQESRSYCTKILEVSGSNDLHNGRHHKVKRSSSDNNITTLGGGSSKSHRERLKSNYDSSPVAFAPIHGANGNPSQKKPRTAPLMAKSMQLFKHRFKR